MLKRLDMYGQIEDRWSRVPQRDISMALLSDGPVTFRTMIRQAAVAFAQALASSAQETLHSHTTAMMPVSCVTFLSFVSQTLVPNGQPMLLIITRSEKNEIQKRNLTD